VSEADFDAVLRVNLKGSFLVGQAVARVMAAAGRGAIVNMSSVNGTLAIPNDRQLQRQQGRHQPADPGDGAGPRRQGHARERRGARHHSHRDWRPRRC
jgi:NAD(P)-dependent dehydrogenase (short-subunit alcohol dehydrogenase family)